MLIVLIKLLIVPEKSLRFLSFETFGFFPLNKIICCSVAEIQRINLTYLIWHMLLSEW